MGQFFLRAIQLKSIDDREIVEGFISTTDPDLYDDIVNENGQKCILEQLNNRSIKLDLDHNKFRDPETGEIYEEEKNMIPPGKIVYAELKNTDNNQLGVWVKAELNKDHSFYDKIKNSINNGFLDAFSIGYNVLKTIPNKTYRIIDKLIIRNVALTGDPVNKNAKAQIALKSIPRKMSEQNTITEEQFNELKSVHETIKAELEEFKSQDYKAQHDEMKAELDKTKAELEEMKKSKKSEMKSLVDSKKEVLEMKSSIESKDVEIKSLKDKVEAYENEPQLKSFIEVKSKVEKELIGDNNQFNPWRLGN